MRPRPATRRPAARAACRLLGLWKLEDTRPTLENITKSAKAIDPADHVLAGLQSLEGTITDRTENLIASHMEAHAYQNGTLGARARVRLQNSEDFEDIMLLRELDRKGRVPGEIVCELADALAYIKALADENDE